MTHEYSEDEFQRLLAGPVQQAAMDGEALGKTMGALRRTLVAEGFEHEQVWEMCREYFMAMIEPAEVAGGDND